MPAGIRSGRSMATNREVAVQINRLFSFFFLFAHTDSPRGPVQSTCIGYSDSAVGSLAGPRHLGVENVSKAPSPTLAPEIWGILRLSRSGLRRMTKRST